MHPWQIILLLGYLVLAIKLFIEQWRYQPIYGWGIEDYAQALFLAALAPIFYGIELLLRAQTRYSRHG